MNENPESISSEVDSWFTPFARAGTAELPRVPPTDYPRHRKKTRTAGMYIVIVTVWSLPA